MSAPDSPARTPFFELHIRPLVRVLDREHMVAAVGLDLWDYEQVCARADAILARVQADMPPVAYGGPWPQEWIELFQRWKDAGFPRLQLGKVGLSGYTAKRVGTQVTLEGRGTLPDSAFQAWLQPVVDEGQPRSFVHYWEPPAGPVAGAPRPFRARETFEATPSISLIGVQDVDGRHDVPIT